MEDTFRPSMAITSDITNTAWENWRHLLSKPSHRQDSKIIKSKQYIFTHDLHFGPK